jgi:hypothetical protein
MIDFVDAHRNEYGVESICAVLPIAPSTYYVHHARKRDPSLRPARAIEDEALSIAIRRVYEESFGGVSVRSVRENARLLQERDCVIGYAPRASVTFPRHRGSFSKTSMTLARRMLTFFVSSW